MSWLARTVRHALRLSILFPALLLVSPPPASAGERTPRKPEPRRAATKDRTAEAKGSTAPGCVHVVRRGESVGRIAAHYRVARRAIVSTNRLVSPDALRTGQRLEIPGCKAVRARRVAEPVVVDKEGKELLARVGPRRVPTRLFVAVPSFDADLADFRWPIDGPVISGFGHRAGGWHAGIDIKGERGAPIRAAAAGTVVVSGWGRFYGNMVKILHQSGFITLYAHNLKNLVHVGDLVDQGTVIATVGRTGHASAHHVHFEIRREDIAYNPAHLLEPRDTPTLASVADPPYDDDTGRE